MRGLEASLWLCNHNLGLALQWFSSRRKHEPLPRERLAARTPLSLSRPASSQEVTGAVYEAGITTLSPAKVLGKGRPETNMAFFSPDKGKGCKLGAEERAKELLHKSILPPLPCPKLLRCPPEHRLEAYTVPAELSQAE